MYGGGKILFTETPQVVAALTKTKKTKTTV